MIPGKTRGRAVITAPNFVGYAIAYGIGGVMGRRVVGTVSTGRVVPMLQRIEDEESGFTKFRLYFMEEEPPIDLLHAGLAEQADHAWWALEMVARAFDPNSDVIMWKPEREIVEDA